MSIKRFEALTPAEARAHLNQFRPTVVLDEMTHLENINEADEVLEFVATCLMTYDDSPAISGASCRGLSTILRFVQRTMTAEVFEEELDDPEPLFRECPKGNEEIGEEGEEARPQTVHPFKKLFEQIDREDGDTSDDDAILNKTEN